MERNIQMQDCTKWEILQVAAQFIPDLSVENDAISVWVNPHAIVVVRQRRQQIEDILLDSDINLFASNNFHNITHQRNVDVVAWYIHGIEPRHVILGLNVRSAELDFLSSPLVLPEMIRYLNATSSGNQSIHQETQLVHRAIKCSQSGERRDQHFRLWLEVMKLIDRDHQLILTYNPLAAAQGDLTRKLVTIERLNPENA